MEYYNFVDDYDELIDFPNLKRLIIGSGKKYFIEKNFKPYLLVEADITSNSFDTACIFGKYLCISIMDTIIFVDLDSL